MSRQKSSLSAAPRTRLLVSSLLSIAVPAVLFCLLGLSAEAAQQCDSACILKNGADTVTAQIENYEKNNNPPQSTSCPADGSIAMDSLAQGQGSISQSEQTVTSLISTISPRYEALKADSSHCGACAQKNVVSIYSTTMPANTSFNPQCSNMPTTVIEKQFDHKIQIAAYLTETLKGSNQDGQHLANQCPDPCSYYITSAQTPMAGDQEHLTLAVQCGQPRSGFILFATYNYKVGIVHSWTCSPR